MGVPTAPATKVKVTSPFASTVGVGGLVAMATPPALIDICDPAMGKVTPVVTFAFAVTIVPTGTWGASMPPTCSASVVVEVVRTPRSKVCCTPPASVEAANESVVKREKEEARPLNPR